MKKALVLLCACMMALVALSPAFAETTYKDEYKLSCNVADTTPQGKAVARFAQLVKEGTGGKVNIKVYWSGQLMSGKATNELLLMKKNVGDFSLSSFINWAPQYPKGNLFLLPWFISSMPDKYKALDAIEAGKAGKMFETDIATMGLRVLGWGEQGARELSNNIRPIRTPADMKDIKFRVVGSPLFLDIFKELGANPMSISWAEALTALQQGTVDGQENPYSVYLPNKIYEFQKYLTEWSYNMDPLIYVVHEDVWKTFPDDVKKVIADAAQECGRYNKALARLGLDDGTSEKWLKERKLYPTEPKDINPRKFVQDYGVKVEILKADEIAAFRAKMNPVFDKWVDKIGKDLVNAAQEDMKNATY